MRRLCTTLQMHSCTAIMLSFSTCQLQRRHSGKAREEMVASTRNLLVRTSSLHGCGQEENSEIRSTRNGPKKQKTGWVARAVQQGHSRPHLAVLDDRVELRGKNRLAVVFPVGHNQPVAISCTSCTTRLMSKSRTQQGRLGFGFGFRLGFMVDDLWFCWQGLDVAIRPRNARGGCSSSVVCAPAHTPAQTHAFAQTCPATAIQCQQPPPSLAALQVRGSETREELKGVRTRAWRNAPVVFKAMRLTSVTCVSARAPLFHFSKRTGRRRASACFTANAGRGTAHCTAPGSDVPAIYSCLVCGPRRWRLPSKCARLRLR